MGTGYKRNDTTNNIADGNVINAADLDGEFDAVEAAFDESTGHTHDGTADEGGPITVVGPVQDLVVSATEVRPKTDNTLDLGTTLLEFKDAFFDGTVKTDNLTVDENATVTGNLTVNGNTTIGNAATDTVIVTADVASNLIPSADNTYDLGATGSEWKDLYIDGTANIDSLVATSVTSTSATVGGSAVATADNTQTLTNKTIDSANNTLTVDLSEATVTGTTAEFNTALSDDNFATLNGTETLTNKTIDSANNTLTVDLSEATVTGTTAEFNTALSDDNFATLNGTETLTNKTIDSANNTLTVDLSEATVTGTTAEFNTALSDDNFATLNGTETLTNKTLTFPDINGGTIDNTVIGGSTPAAGSFTTLSATGNVTLGNAATDTVTITADVASNVIPSADNTYDLGAPGSEWKNLYIDGTANIDSLVANTADINGGTVDGATLGGNSQVTITDADMNGGTIDNTVIGGSTPAAGSFTTLNTSGAVVFNEAGADVDFRIESDTDANAFFLDGATGNVGIGTSSPTAKLDVRGSIAATDGTKDARINDDGSLELTRDDGVAYIDFRSALAEDFDCRIQQASDGLAFQTGGNGSTAERMRIDSSGNLLVGTTTSPSDTNAIVASGGVYLGGTGSANLLDDYEEGTWTGSVSINGFTQSVSSIAGTYTKVGRLVTIHYTLNLSSAGYASGYSLWSGLPFTSGTNSQAGGYYATANISDNIIGSTHFVGASSSSVYIFQSTSTSNTQIWMGSFHYYTA